jgi:hypothetical protein
MSSEMLTTARVGEGIAASAGGWGLGVGAWGGRGSPPAQERTSPQKIVVAARAFMLNLLL